MMCATTSGWRDGERKESDGLDETANVGGAWGIGSIRDIDNRFHVLH